MSLRDLVFDLSDKVHEDRDKRPELYSQLNTLFKEKNKEELISLLVKTYDCDYDAAKALVDFEVDHIQLPPPTDLSPEQIAYNNAIAREWQNKPKCPTCGSERIKKISTTAKVVGAAMFGLFSKTAKSQFKCEKCGYKW